MPTTRKLQTPAAEASALPQSLVYQRYNGFMLGFIVGLLRLEFMRPQYKIHRARLLEVMDELGVPWQLPKTHSAYARDSKLQRDLGVEMKLGGQPLVDSYAFGLSVVYMLIDPASKTGRTAARTIDEIAAEQHLDQTLLAERMRLGWPQRLEGDRAIAELLSRAYDLVALYLTPLPKEPQTCFVIMPFAEPFRGYYRTFYRESLNRAGFVAIRAWEGVTNEHYLQMLFSVLHKCGAALADLSASSGSSVANLNAIHEVGLNMGAGNVTFLLRQDREVSWPSNLTGLPYVTYDPTADDWPQGQANEVARVLSEMTSWLTAR